jgi:hypothetical protein
MMALWLPHGGVLHLGQHGGGARWTSRCSHLGTVTPEKLPDGRPGYVWRDTDGRQVELGVLGADHVPGLPICISCWKRMRADLIAVQTHRRRHLQRVPDVR